MGGCNLRPTHLAICAVGLWMGACASPVAPALSARALSPWATDVDPTAFDPLDPDATLTVDDTVSYRIESNADGTLRTWTVSLGFDPSLRAQWGKRWPKYDQNIEENPDPVSGRVRARASQHTVSHPDKEGLIHTYSSPCRLPICVELARGDTGQRETVSSSMQAIVHLTSTTVDRWPSGYLINLVLVLLDIDRLAEELLSVIRPPSVWSVLMRGMKVGLSVEFDDAAATDPERIDTPFGPQLTYWLPFTVLANDQIALRGKFLMTWKQSPLLLSLGVLRIEAHHPDDESKQVVAHLIAARRGRQTTPDPDDFGGGLRRGMTPGEVARIRGYWEDEQETWVARDEEGRIASQVTVARQLRFPGKIFGGSAAVFAADGLCFLGFQSDVQRYLDLRGFERVTQPERPPR